MYGNHCHSRHAARGFAHRGYGRWGGGWGGRGRRGRVFDQGDLRLVVLKLIAEKPRHGYEVIKAIEEDVGGAYAPSPGIVYPTLQMLEELGHVALSSEEGGKKLYAITEAGRSFLAENKSSVDAMLKRIDNAKRIYGGGPPPQLVRAMENLRLALRLRLERGELSEERIAEIAAALDAAAAEVERR